MKAREAEEALKAAPFEQREIHRIKKDGQEYLEHSQSLRKRLCLMRCAGRLSRWNAYRPYFCMCIGASRKYFADGQAV